MLSSLVQAYASKAGVRIPPAVLILAVVTLALLTACAIPTPTPTPPPLGLEPTFALAPTFVITPAPHPGGLLFDTKGCSACHAIRGKSISTVGPDLTHIGSEAAFQKPSLTAEEYIRESIEKPDAFVVEGYTNLMPSVVAGMTEDELADLVEFLLLQQ